ncbi:hypothetical protein QTP81_14980 [Alteromonas sp. ASW11-36]|uniref:PEP-CTERM sorting domain-containing protein n=1 Tax=Alteromonas arenosi TaxID=3055817 RepID=A0ABT7T0F2_9ALTE|nr:hypothetical protein [Alteromonas sp. ASW11-36]MDM7861905.1 hypothetical protein [Alteromonas sp. ASW11-36]
MKRVTFALLAVLSFPCSADIIRLDVIASVSEITEYLGNISTAGRGDHNFHNDTIDIGTTMTATYLYDTNTEKGVTLADDPNSAIYRAIAQTHFSVGNWTYSHETDWPYSFAPRSYLIVRNDRQDEYFPDTFYASSSLFYSPALDIGPGEEYASFTFTAYSIDNIGLDSTAIPTSFSIEDFDVRQLNMLHSTRHDASETRRFLSLRADVMSVQFTNISNITSVPAPPVIWLLLCAIPLLLNQMQTRRNHT